MAREMRGVNALEGPELGAIMAQAMRQRVRNNTNTAQRARVLSNMARNPQAEIAVEEAEAAEAEAASEWWSNMRAMERMDERRIAEDLARQRMANAPGRGLQVDPNDPMNLAGGDPMWPGAVAQPPFQGQLGGTNAEEEALLAQMQADMVNQPGAQGFTSEGYVPGGAGALPQATSVPQTTQVAGPTGSSQAGPQGFTSPGYVEGGAAALPQATSVPQEPQVAGPTGASQAQQPGPQGFTSPGYVQGEQAGEENNAALKWLNDLFKKDEQPQGGQPQDLQPFTPPGPQGFTSEGYVPGGPSALGGGMSPEEQQKLQQITQGLESSRPDSNADATVSWPTGTDDSGFPPIGGISGQAREVSGSEQNVAIVQSLMSELETLGIDANILRRFDIDVDKFLSGAYNMADVEKLMSLAKRAGAPASMRGRIQTMSDNVSGTSGHGFNAEGYNEGVKQKPDETFMQYTQRMHQRNKDMNQWQDPDNAWVDPDRP